MGKKKWLLGGCCGCLVTLLLLVVLVAGLAWWGWSTVSGGTQQVAQDIFGEAPAGYSTLFGMDLPEKNLKFVVLFKKADSLLLGGLEIHDIPGVDEADLLESATPEQLEEILNAAMNSGSGRASRQGNVSIQDISEIQTQQGQSIRVMDALIQMKRRGDWPSVTAMVPQADGSTRLIVLLYPQHVSDGDDDEDNQAQAFAWQRQEMEAILNETQVLKGSAPSAKQAPPKVAPTNPHANAA